MVPDSVNDMLWNDILKHFTLPKCVQPNFVKGWTLSRMTTQLKNFKKQVDRNYFKKRTPNLDEYLKLIDHWESFMEYKKSEEFTKASARGNKSVGKRGSTSIVLGVVVTRLQFPSDIRWTTTCSPKVSYQRSLTGPNDRKFGIMLTEADWTLK